MGSTMRYIYGKQSTRPVSRCRCSLHRQGVIVSAQRQAMRATEHMYVADLDLTQDLDDIPDSDSPPIQVPAMDTIAHMADVDLPHTDSRKAALALARDNTSLREELAHVQGQLTASTESVQHLQMQLADRERTLQATKADLIETRLELQRTEDRLKDVQTRLTTATNERSEYRQYLLEAQAELQATRDELMEWSDGLTELKSVMEGLDDDLTDLFGEGEYTEAVSRALDYAKTSPVHGHQDWQPQASSSNGSSPDNALKQSQIAAALQGLTELSAEVLRQAREDRKLFEDL